MKARFRLYVSDGWVTYLPLNEEASAMINGRRAALRPLDYESSAQREKRFIEMATILKKTDENCGIFRPLESYWPLSLFQGNASKSTSL